MNQDQIPLERAKAILARATSIEADLAGSISMLELRSIGREAGIDPKAIDLAIREELRPATRSRPAAPARAVRWPFAGMVVGIAWGTAMTLLDAGTLPLVGTVLGLGGMMMSVGAIAGLLRRRGAYLQFHLSNCVLWTGFVLARLWGGGLAGYSFLGDIAMLWAVTGLIGSAIVGFSRTAEDGQTSRDSRGPALRERLRRTAVRLRGAASGIWELLKTPLRRSRIVAET